MCFVTPLLFVNDPKIRYVQDCEIIPSPYHGSVYERCCPKILADSSSSNNPIYVAGSSSAHDFYHCCHHSYDPEESEIVDCCCKKQNPKEICHCKDEVLGKLLDYEEGSGSGDFGSGDFGSGVHLPPYDGGIAFYDSPPVRNEFQLENPELFLNSVRIKTTVY